MKVRNRVKPVPMFKTKTSGNGACYEDSDTKDNGNGQDKWLERVRTLFLVYRKEAFVCHS